MEEAKNKKAPIVAYMDRVGQIFVGATLVLTCVGFLLGLGIHLNEAINRALAVAIIVCPCTFALATPLALSLAISRAAKNGLLVKTTEAIERLSHIRTVFFDKTGTLTQGNLTVTRWEEFLPEARKAVWGLESLSAHPIAKALIRYFSETKKLPTINYKVDHFKEKAGVGVSGEIDGSFFEIKNYAENQIAIWKDGVIAGIATLHDQLRPDSRQSVSFLKKLGLDIKLISGDLRRPALEVAEQVGISTENVIAQASPETKNETLKNHPKSLMVGDGANDAIALASAYASVAVQGGMEVSIRAADVYSSKQGVRAIPILLIIARETMKVIHRNLAFAVLFNIIGIAFALSGHLSPLFAAILMPISALSVFLSTLWGTRAMREVSQ